MAVSPELPHRQGRPGINQNTVDGIYPEIEQQKQRPNRSQIERKCRQLHPQQLRLRRRRPGAGQRSVQKASSSQAGPYAALNSGAGMRSDVESRKRWQLRVGGTRLVGVQPEPENAGLPTVPIRSSVKETGKGVTVIRNTSAAAIMNHGCAAPCENAVNCKQIDRLYQKEQQDRFDDAARYVHQTDERSLNQNRGDDQLHTSPDRD